MLLAGASLMSRGCRCSAWAPATTASALQTSLADAIRTLLRGPSAQGTNVVSLGAPGAGGMLALHMPLDATCHYSTSAWVTQAAARHTRSQLRRSAYQPTASASNSASSISPATINSWEASQAAGYQAGAACGAAHAAGGVGAGVGAGGTGAGGRARAAQQSRIGYGGKVAVPTVEVLQEPIVAEPARLRMRGYHLGARIHIGRLLAHAQQQGLRTTYGKDYVMVWLAADGSAAAAGAASGGCGGCADGAESLGASNLGRGASAASSPAAAPGVQDAGAGAGAVRTAGPAAAAAGAARGVPAVGASAAAKGAAVAAAAGPGAAAGAAGATGAVTAADAHLMVAYRYGAVVFLGNDRRRDAGIMQQQLHPSFLYRGGRDLGAAEAVQALHADTYLLEVDPAAALAAAKATDRMVVQVLDVGNARVASSILAQSVALDFYKGLVEHYITRLRSWKDRETPSQRSRGIFYSSHDRTLFRMMAESSLAIIEARGLLAMAEPAWRYDVYHTAWQLLYQDFDLEQRFRALQLMISQVEEEASFDLNTRHERRYGKLVRAVIWLLIVSTGIALLELATGLSKAGKRSSKPLPAAADGGKVVGGDERLWQVKEDEAADGTAGGGVGGSVLDGAHGVGDVGVGDVEGAGILAACEGGGGGGGGDGSSAGELLQLSDLPGGKHAGVIGGGRWWRPWGPGGGA